MLNRLPRFVPFGQPSFSEVERKAVLDTLTSGWVGAGPQTIVFEREFASYVRSPEAVAVASCTSALHLSLLSLGIGRGDEVITSPMTFVATASAILMTGATVRFADVDNNTYNLDPQTVERSVTARTRAIISVHFGGLPVDLDRFKQIARRHRLAIVEDAAHAVGARYQGTMIGASGNLVCFSFYPNKNITTIEGGMITLRDSRRAKRLRMLRMHGLDVDAWKRFHRKSLRRSLAVMPGFKSNFTDVQAAIGLHQLRQIETWQRRREQYAHIYDAHFRQLPGVQLQHRPTDHQRNRHSLHLYTLRLDRRRFRVSRDVIVRSLLRKNIGASIHYHPAHLHPLFRSMGYRRGDFPVAEAIGREIFTLPLTPHLSERTIRAIAQITRTTLHKSSKH